MYLQLCYFKLQEKYVIYDRFCYNSREPCVALEEKKKNGFH